MKKHKISNLNVLNEAYEYEKPSCFSRGLSIVVKKTEFIYISGTASINENGESIHIDDFESQTIRAFTNVKRLLESSGATWKDVVKTTIFIKDIEKNYDQFNKIRKQFFEQENIETYPASVCIQATLCRPELLIEMDANAIVKV